MMSVVVAKFNIAEIKHIFQHRQNLYIEIDTIWYQIKGLDENISKNTSHLNVIGTIKNVLKLKPE